MVSVGLASPLADKERELKLPIYGGMTQWYKLNQQASRLVYKITA
jgi:hypothetical protein